MPSRLFRILLWPPQRHLLALAVLAVVTLLVWAFLNRGNIAVYLEYRSDRDRERNRVERLDAETARLEKERDVLRRGGFESEKVARERFRLSKPGEHVLYLRPPKPDDAPTTGTSLKSNIYN